jgi:hypothetical protein
MNDTSTPLLRSIAATVGKLGLTDLAPVGAGLEFHVRRARHPAWECSPSSSTERPPTPGAAEKPRTGSSTEPGKDSPSRN